MAIPKYPFQVHVDIRNGDKVTRISKNFEHLVQAEDYANKARKAAQTRRVQVLVVIDDVTLTGTGVRYDDTGRTR